jgi:crotonobetainyl-CoA:carnitine CoA-transferase CaiB-like acyl-CoA transferase
MHLSSYGEKPTSVAGSPGDTITSTMATVGILAALYQARKTGTGKRVDVAQMDTLFSLVPVPMMSYFLDKKDPFGMNPNPEAVAEPPYSTLPFPIKRIRGTYPTKDGYVAISALLKYTDIFFDLVGVDEPKVLDEWNKNKSISHETYPLVVDWIKGKTTKDIMEIFNKHNMPAAPVNTFHMLENEPQFAEREMVFDYNHEKGFKYKAIGQPIKLSGSEFDIYRPAPTHGQHTNEILTTLLNYSEEEIAQMRKDKIIS